MEVRPHSSPESSQLQEWGLQFTEPPVVPEVQGGPQQSSQPELANVRLWAEGGGCPFTRAPYLPGTCFLAIASFIVCLPTYQKDHMPVFSLLCHSA